VIRCTQWPKSLFFKIKKYFFSRTESARDKQNECPFFPGGFFLGFSRQLSVINTSLLQRNTKLTISTLNKLTSGIGLKAKIVLTGSYSRNSEVHSCLILT
jgi:hypothetical protein